MTTKAQSFEAELSETFGGGEDAAQTWQDIARGGADAGWPGLTYYKDTTELYERHEAEIWAALEEDADSLGNGNPLALIGTFGGARNVVDVSTFKNLLVWYMAERVAYRMEDAEASEEA